jgi:N-acetylmuramoyl-L-alanine amidase
VIVILDRQHAGKPGKEDRGASVELDGRTVYEVDLTRAYIEAATDLLNAEGHAVYLLEDGWYSARHARACEIARENPDERIAYVACHINAGGGSYGLVLHDARSRGGHALAEAVADALGTDNAALDRTLVRAADHEGAWARAMTTIEGIYSGPGNLSGICYEPFFIDSERNRALMTDDGLRAVGNALAVGCMQWGE